MKNIRIIIIIIIIIRIAALPQAYYMMCKCVKTALLAE